MRTHASSFAARTMRSRSTRMQAQADPVPRLPAALGWLLAAGLALGLAGTAEADTRYVVKTGADAGACTSGSPCLTINYALSQANPSGDDIVFLDTTPQVYAENLVLTKSVTITGNGSDPVVGNRTTIRSSTGGANKDVITVRAPNVVLENVIIFVDFANTRQGVRAESSAAPAFTADGLTVRQTLVRVESTAPPAPAYEERNAIMVNPTSGPHFSVVVEDVRIDGTPLPAPGIFFRAGVDARSAAVTVTGSDILTINHDLKLTEVSGTILVEDNTFRFGGVQLGSYNASSGGPTSVQVSGNRFFPGAAPLFPGLRLLDNTAVGAGPGGYVATLVEDNQFGGTAPLAPTPELGLAIGIFAQNYRALDVVDNTFNPYQTVAPFTHIYVSNKVAYTGAPLPPQTLTDISIRANLFNGYAPSSDGVALEFLNHNSVGATFGDITVGGAGTDANTFDDALDSYFHLSNESGLTGNPYFYTAPAIIDPTAMAPFAGDILAPDNLFDLGGGPEASSAMTVAELVAVNQKTQDRRDHAALSLAAADIGVIVFGDENAAYSHTDPRTPSFFLPVAADLTFEACDGSENFTGCYELTLENASGTAVPEHSEIEFRISAAPSAALTLANLALEYEATAATGGAGWVGVGLSVDGNDLVGRIPTPSTAITLPPIAVEADAQNLLDGLRLRFARPGQYTVTTRLVGKETTDVYGTLDSDTLNVANLAFTATGPSAADIDSPTGPNDPSTYDITITNTDGAVTEPLLVRIRVSGDDAMALADLALSYEGENDCALDGADLLCTFDNAGAGFTIAAGGTVNHTMTVDFAVGDDYDYTFEVLSFSGSPERSYASFGPITTQVGDVELSVSGVVRVANVDITGVDATYTLTLDNTNGGLTENLNALVRVFGQDELACAALTLAVTGDSGAFAPTCAAIGAGANAGAIEFTYGPFTIADGATLTHAIAADFAGSDIFHFEFEVVSAPAGAGISYDETAYDYTVAGEEQGGTNTFLVRSQANTGFSHDANFDNDFTRINRVVQNLVDGERVRLQGVFEWWNNAEAQNSWAAGSNGILDGWFPIAPGDDFSLAVPAGLDDIEFTSSAACSGSDPTTCGATIRGAPFDLPFVQLERFLSFHEGVYLDLRINGLRVEGFDAAIWQRNTSTPGAFNGSQIIDNEFVVLPDAPDGLEPFPPGYEGFVFNRAIYAGIGTGLVAGNRIWMQAGGLPGSYALGPYGQFYNGSRSIGIELQVSNSNNFTGFFIVDNTITPLGPTPGEFVGIWENAADCGSTIAIFNNRFHGSGGPAGQFGLRLSSFGSLVDGNVVTGAQAGIHWTQEVGNFCGGSAPVLVTRNTLLDNGHAVLIENTAPVTIGATVYPADAVSATLLSNRLVDNTVGFEDRQDGAASSAVQNNWWGCNAGPTDAACDSIVDASAPITTATSWLQLRIAASPTTIDAGMTIGPEDTSALTISFVRSSDSMVDPGFTAIPPATDPALYLDDNTRSLSAGTGNVSTPTLTFAGGVSNATYNPNVQGVDAVTANVDGQAVSLDILTLVNLPPLAVIVEAFDITGGTPDDIDNDYTRINRAVQLLTPNTTLILRGSFDWTENFAREDFAYGSDGTVGNSDDWSITLPHNAGLNGIAIRAAVAGGGGVPGGASITAGNDVEKAFDSGQGLTSGQTKFLRTSSATVGSFTNAQNASTFHGLTIENLTLDGFDSGILLALGTNGFTYSNARFANNVFVIHPDTDGAGQLGLLTGYGTGQAIEDNQFLIDTGASQQPSRYTGFATGSGGASGQYDDLLIDGNTVAIDGTPGALPPRVIGLWENGEDSNSSVQVTDNVVTGSSGVAGSHQIGLIVTTHSNGPNLVEVRGNTVTNAAIGLTTQYQAFGHYVAASGAQIVEGNDFSGNGVGVRLRQGSGAPANAPATTLRLNRIVGNGAGLALDPAAGPEILATATADDNWWGCNAGPGASTPGCVGTANSSGVAPASWLRLHVRSDGLAQSGSNESFDAALSADPTGASIAPADLPSIYLAGPGQAAQLDVAFDSSMGSVTSPVAFAAGIAPNTLVTVAPEDQGGALLAATYDAQTVNELVRVAPAGCVTPAGPCEFVIEPADTPDALDNDYTRINNAVQAAAAGDEIQLLGDFVWTLGDARTSWEAGSNGIVDGSDFFFDQTDDWTVHLPFGIHDVWLGAAAPGSASITGDQGNITDNLTAFVLGRDATGDATPTNTGWTFRNLTLTGFDVAIALVAPAGGNDDFDGTQILDNTIEIAPDIGDFYGNFGAYIGYGSGQVVRGNTINIDLTGAAVGDNPRHFGLWIGDSCNNACFDGLEVGGNTIAVTGTPLAGTLPTVYGIFENALDGNSAVLVEDNELIGSGGSLGTGVESNNQIGLISTTLSNGANQSIVRGNDIRGFMVGLTTQRDYSYFVAAPDPIVIEGNTLVDNGEGIRITASYTAMPARAQIRFNRIANNTLNGLVVETADLLPNGLPEIGSEVAANDNWWGCNTGPGSGAGCTAISNGVDAGSSNTVTVDTWLTLAAATDTPVVSIGGLALIDADVNTNSALTNLAAQTVFPSCTPIGFASDSSATLDAATRGTGVGLPGSCAGGVDPGNAVGVANNTLRTILSDTEVTVSLDQQDVTVTVQVEDVLLAADIPPAAALDVTTQPFDVTVSNDSPSSFSNLDVYFSITFLGDDASTAIAPTDLLLEYQCGPAWCPLTLTNLDANTLVGEFPVGTLGAGASITVPVRATFGLDGVFSIDAVLVDDTQGITYAEDGGDVSVAGPDDVTLTLLSGSPQTAPVNSDYVAPVVVRVQDEAGNPLSGMTVDFDPAGGIGTPDVSFDVPAPVTDEDGEASSGTITANGVAGAVDTATASIDSTFCSTANCSVDLDFTNTATAPASIELVRTPASPVPSDSAVVGAAFEGGFCATVLDATNNPVANVSVTFTASSVGGASGTFSPNPQVTDVDGEACTTVTANTVAGGTYSVTATVAASPSALSDTAGALTNVADDPAALIIVSGNNQTAPLGASYAPLVVRLVDQYGNAAVPAEAVTFTAPAMGASATPGTVSQSGSEFSVTPTANNIAGTFTVVADYDGAFQASFTLTNTATSPADIEVDAGTASATVNTAFADTVCAVVEDAGGVDLPGVSVTFSASTVGGASASFSPNPALTDGSGEACTTVTANTVAGGPYAVTASVAAAPMTISDTAGALTNVAGAPDALIIVSGNNQTAPLGAIYAPLVVRLVDEFGNAATPTVAATFTAPTMGATASLGTVSQSGSEWSVTPTANNIAGTFSVVADYDGDFQATFTLTNTATNPASVELDLGTASATVNTTFADPVCALVQDADDVDLPGISVTFSASIAFGGATATFEPNPALTDGDGIACTTMRANTVAGGTYDVVATVAATPMSISDSDGVFTNVADAPNALIIVAGDNQTAPLGADYAPLVVRLVDQFGNAATPTETVTFTAPAMGPSVTFGAVTPSGSQWSVTPTANNIAGSLSVLADYDGTFQATFNLTNTATNPASVSLDLGTASATVDTAFADPVCALVQDDDGVDLPGISVTFSASNTAGASATFSPNPALTDGDGIACTTMTANIVAGGPYDVTATVAATPSALSDTDGAFTNLAGAPDALIIVSGNNQTAPLGASYAPLVVRLVDAYGNAATPTEMVTFTAPTMGASATLGAVSQTGSDWSVTPTANNIAGSFLVLADYDGDFQSTFTLTNTATSPASVDLDVGTASATVDTAFAAQACATIRDDDSVLLPGISVTFSASSAGGASATFSPNPVVTDGDGEACATVTANTVAGGPYAVTATVAADPMAISDTAGALTNVAGAPDALIIVSGNNQTAPLGAIYAPLVVRLVDEFGNAATPTVAATFTAPTMGATATLGTVTQTGSEWSVTPTANNIAGTFSVLADYDGDFQATFTLTNTATNPASVSMDLGTASATVNTDFADPVCALVQDDDDVDLPGISVTFGASTAAGGASATFEPNPALTDGDGIACTTMTANTVAGGTYAVTATVAATPMALSDSDGVFTNVADAPDALVIVSGNNQTAPLGAAYAPLVVRLVDQFGNAATPAVAATFTAPAMGATATLGTVTQTGSEWSVTPTANNVAGTFTVLADYDGDFQASFTLTNTATSPASVDLDVGTASATVNTAFAAQACATVRDDDSVLLPGISVTFSASTVGGASASFSPNPALTDGSGEACSTVTANTVAGGPYAVSATVAASPMAISDTAGALTNVAGAAAALNIVSGNNQSVAVNTAFVDLVVRAVDAFGNPVQGVSVAFAATPAGNGASASISGSPDVSGADGIASASATANGIAGAYVVTASAGALSTQFSLANTLGSIVIDEIRWDANDLTTVTYTGAAQVAAYDTSPVTAPADCSVTYNGVATAPSAAGDYLVQVSCSNAGFSGTASAILTIAKAGSGITLGGGSFVYDGAAKPATVTNPNDAAYTLSYAGTGSTTYGPSPVPPINVGTYQATLTVDDPNYSEAAALTASIEITPATVTLTFGNLSQVYDGNAKAATVSTTPAGVAGVTLSYAPDAAPTNAGSYMVTADLDNDNYVLGGTTTATLTILKATAQVNLFDLTRVHDGNPKPVSVTTAPSGLGFNVTYDGSATAPSAVGSYAVVATVADLNYEGSANGTLTILAAAVSQFLLDSATPVDGVAGAPLDAADLPRVRVLDNNGNGVAGISVLFEVTSGGGSATGTPATTGADGRATVGSWTLGADAGSNTMTARVNGLSGLPTHTFTANGEEEAGVTLTKSSASTEANPGQAVTYTIVVTHAAGPSNAASVDILDELPFGLDASTATWICAGAGGADCDVASGNGDVDVNSFIPVGGSVTITLSANISAKAPAGPVVNSATADLESSVDPTPENNTDDHTIEIVPAEDGPCAMFCDGFEGTTVVAAKALDATMRAEQPRIVELPALRSPFPQPLFEVRGTDGRALAALEVLQVGEKRWFRWVQRNAPARERIGAWLPLRSGAVGFDWVANGKHALLRGFAVGGDSEVVFGTDGSQAQPAVLRIDSTTR